MISEIQENEKKIQELEEKLQFMKLNKFVNSQDIFKKSDFMNEIMV